MIEIQNLEEGRPGGSLQYSFDVVLKPYGELTILGCKLMKSGNQTWVNFPQIAYDSQSGEKKYKKVISWPDKTDKKLKAEIKSALEKYLEANPDFATKSVFEGVQDPFTEIPF